MPITNRIVINNCYGGFGLSQEAIEWMVNRGLEEKYYELNPDYVKGSGEWGKREKYYLNTYDIPRHHPLLVKCVETLGNKANGDCAELVVIEIEGNMYRIDEYDGSEGIETPDIVDWIVIDSGLSNKQKYGKDD